MKILMCVANAIASAVAIVYVPGVPGTIIVFASSLCIGVMLNQGWHEIFG